MMLVSLLIYWAIVSLVQGLPGAKGYRNSGEVAKIGIQPEPTCEELKAMWRFSKRQSRAAELTNELPMYPDPFAENVWQNYYATSRSIAGRRPVAFGKISYAPSKNKINPEYLMPYLQYGPQTAQPRRRPATSFRLPGGGNIISNYPPQAGSFDHLKELIKTERARELQQQRLVEENAARAAVMKDTGRHQPGRYTTDHFSYHMVEPQEILFSSDMPEIEEDEPIPVEDRTGIITFPDILAPKERMSPEMPIYNRDHPRMRSHGPNLFDASFFPEEYGGYML
ncbi:uncharacterized protein LOC109541154 [Dendroctonus ponderosae]|uniref:Uncharacterized protein n=1 Tax=Dendroctonus ponderosae TaxID=77166 RepID=A0AAR5PXC2_DENPD|nr:uncharacterized protein LOC109541154 [Dendroctonus ponderosae]KAH1023668.1 hypothetical protein HUJ04_012830 [Dendroctonus ponderosae]KAH1030114.1 hypothetical protein HUJ05_003235 [Dendroctonus ponderosae]